jgi:hypothetical protein
MLCHVFTCAELPIELFSRDGLFTFRVHIRPFLLVARGDIRSSGCGRHDM